MDRALPGRMIDLIRNGVTPADLKARGNRAVYGALVSTAASAQLRGWDRVEWEDLVCETRSLLGRQVRLRDGHREHTPRALSRTLFDAWEDAWEWRTSQPAMWDRDDVRREACSRAAAMLQATDDPDADLTDAERRVLVYAAEQGIARGLTRVALPRQAVIDGTGLTERQVRRAMTSLDERRLLPLHERGRQGAEGKRRAGLYGLPDGGALDMCRVPRPVGQLTRPMGQPEDGACGAGAKPMGQQQPDPAEEEQEPMDSITLTREQIVAALGEAAFSNCSPRSVSPSPPRSGTSGLSETSADGPWRSVKDDVHLRSAIQQPLAGERASGWRVVARYQC